MKLPLSGTEIMFRALDGHVEAMIADLAPDRPMAAGLAILDALMDARGIDPRQLTLTDFEYALAMLRCHLVGEDAACAPHCASCGEQMEISFSLALLADSVAKRVPVGTGEEADPGYRLPTAGDALAVEGYTDAPRRLIAACVEAPVSAAPLRRRIERAMARRAPLLSRVIEAPCAACGALLRAIIHVPSFVAMELAREARSLFDDVHMLARGYGWHEAEILALPRVRRQRYVARLREAG
jgi:hypothetical protein